MRGATLAGKIAEPPGLTDQAEYRPETESSSIPDCRARYASSGHAGWPQEHAISTSSFPASLQMSPQ
jgi:hypothetical protein